MTETQSKVTAKQDEILVMRGVEGISVYINSYRVAGPKPWGGGTVVKQWKGDRKHLETALDSKQ